MRHFSRKIVILAAMWTLVIAVALFHKPARAGHKSSWHAVEMNLAEVPSYLDQLDEKPSKVTCFKIAPPTRCVVFHRDR
jgi:hypothetical protein